MSMTDANKPVMANVDQPKTVLKTALEKGWIGGTSGAAAMTIQVLNSSNRKKD